MRRIVWVIDSISESSGKVVAWLCLALVLVLCYEVVLRYVFNAPTLWSPAIACMAGLTIYTLGLAYTHRHHGHVRVDVFYRLLSPRGQAIIDVVATLLFLIPLLSILIYISWTEMLFSWAIKETVAITFWYPPAGPIRTIFVLGCVLFILQGVAQLVRDLYLVIRNKPL